MKTLGGRQFWGDVRFFRGWRIQQNVFTKHYRLLDPKDIRKAFGSLPRCCDKLEEIKRAQRLPPMSGKAAIVIHGITRSSKMLSKMRMTLGEAGYTVVPFDYPSTRVGILESAAYLSQVIGSLDGVEEIYIVVHSLGGLVARAYLKENRDARIKRLVMIGTPNSGSPMADLVRRIYPYRLVFGPAGQQLVTDADGLISTLPIPNFEFAIIAGGRGPKGYNPLIRGDDDSLVTVESAQLPGAADFLVVPVLHTLLPNNAKVIKSTINFFETGRLRIDGPPEPIPPLRASAPAE